MARLCVGDLLYFTKKNKQSENCLERYKGKFVTRLSFNILKFWHLLILEDLNKIHKLYTFLDWFDPRNSNKIPKIGINIKKKNEMKICIWKENFIQKQILILMKICFWKENIIPSRLVVIYCTIIWDRISRGWAQLRMFMNRSRNSPLFSTSNFCLIYGEISEINQKFYV